MRLVGSNLIKNGLNNTITTCIFWSSTFTIKHIGLQPPHHPYHQPTISHHHLQLTHLQLNTGQLVPTSSPFDMYLTSQWSSGHLTFHLERTNNSFANSQTSGTLVVSLDCHHTRSHTLVPRHLTPKFKCLSIAFDHQKTSNHQHALNPLAQILKNTCPFTECRKKTANIGRTLLTHRWSQGWHRC